MITSVEQHLQTYPRPYITDVELGTLLGGTADSRYSKVKRMLAQSQLIHIRRGLYGLTSRLGHKEKLHPYSLAHHIYSPSYISLESALSYHQLIPEAVYTVTSVCTKRAKEFHTPFGVFSYMHLPNENFYIDVELITEDNHSFFVAKPWKAICDFIFCYKKNWRSLEPLANDLRINIEMLPILSSEEMALLEAYYHHSRVSRFLLGIKYER